VIPFHFGPTNRRLFGLFQPVQDELRGARAALLCNPFGQEAVRTHRMYRVLADRLVREGIGVMRFDYYGAGDSAGDDAAGDMVGWMSDIAAAHAELRRRSAANTVLWIGVRLGATLAIGTADGVAHPPIDLVLWEPIVDGAGYLREMADRHVRELEVGYHPPDPPWREVLESILPGLDRDGMGFEIGDKLRAQLGQLSPNNIVTPGVRHCVLVEQGNRPEIANLAKRWRQAGVDVSERVFAHQFDWMATEALNTALVPSEAIRLLTSLATNGND
jgi:uncharacterized protein